VRPLEAFAGEHDLEQVLGSGAFATVYSAKHLATGEQRAVKIMRLAGMSSAAQYPGSAGGLSASDQARAVLREVSVLASLHHPHVVRLLGVYCGGLGDFEDVGPQVDRAAAARSGNNAGGTDSRHEGRAHGASHGSASEKLALEWKRSSASSTGAAPHAVPPGWLRLGGSDADGGGLLVPLQLLAPPIVPRAGPLPTSGSGSRLSGVEERLAAGGIAAGSRTRAGAAARAGAGSKNGITGQPETTHKTHYDYDGVRTGNASST